MNESLKIIFGMLAILLWNSSLIFLKDKNPTRQKMLNFFMLVTLLWLFAPLLISAIISYGGNPYSEGSGGGAFLWLYIIVAPTGAIAYLILLVLKIVYAIKAEQPAKNWLLFAGIYLLAPLLFSFSLGIAQDAKPKTPYDGYNSMGVAVSPDYPDKLMISLMYYYPGGENVKESKFFLVDYQYEPSSSVDDYETLMHARKQDVWYYFSETGDTLKTELYNNDSLISTKIYDAKPSADRVEVSEENDTSINTR